MFRGSGIRALDRIAQNAPPDDWNIFPDPTTGKIDVYHKGECVGAIDGTEPQDQDPPVPHKADMPGFDY